MGIVSYFQTFILAKQLSINWKNSENNCTIILTETRGRRRCFQENKSRTSWFILNVIFKVI